MGRLLLIALTVLAASIVRAEPVTVCATTSSLGALVREVGGDDVSLTVFAKGTEDPHFVLPRPSFIRRLAGSDLVVLNGMELEIGWLPPLLQNSRNRRVLPGGPGYVDASTVIAPLGVPADLSRAAGDVHPYGNPHYLLDPLNGLAVAALLRDRLAQARPERAKEFAGRFEDFERRLLGALLGEPLLRKYGAGPLARLAAGGTFEGESLEGWLGRLRGVRGRKVVADHDLWPYFAQRFGLEVIGFLEPKPGVPPTTRHLRELIERMRAQQVSLILSAAYYDPRHASFVAESTGARVVEMAHEAGAQPGTEAYLAWVDYNVASVAGP